MEIITIRVSALTLEVVKGRAKHARLKYQAAGLEIYVVGAIAIARRDAVNHMATSECLSRHIPLKSLKSYGWV